MTWMTPSDVVEIWPDAPDDWLLYAEAAHEQCAAFAPPLAEGAEVPNRYRLAECMQARALHRSTVAGSGDQIGGEVQVQVFPMDWTVKNLLRPRPGVPVVI